MKSTRCRTISGSTPATSRKTTFRKSAKPSRNQRIYEGEIRESRPGRERRQGPKLHTSKRIFNTAKVSDHHAIIPTGTFAKLSEAEQKVYDMVVKRTIAVFYPHAEFEQTTRLHD